ncbi:peroxide stress protein YaaA [Janthinobacterium sp. 17J80-10]|uniref:peroxide stress protein YaaA n=1 Tax=Janthinobacterium sp. 17J80-10 TaxID=2497863 RepID=UPI00100534B9|nr:peroxide stress protein YaaA [Janthinobacterium sp. 17J80-10]QAU34287.1 peroxide stress protein YaaA [Janthinobacterium sp. 17J80-10]
MLIVLSPAKSLDYETPVVTDSHTLPAFIPEAARLIECLREFSPAQIASLMKISDPLASLNHGRYASWSSRFTRKNSRQAVLAFNGDVYEGLDAPTLAPAALDYVQAHVRILSGLYGVLRPLDLMQPYRLEMGTKLATAAGRDLYAYWGEQVSENLNAVLAERRSEALVNLASEEYFKSVKPKLLSAPVVTPVFEEWKDGRYKIISFYAKRARGLMARYAAQNRIVRARDLQSFDSDGYRFDAKASNENTWVFRRRQAA